ncbi:Hypothetical predicted protein [Paramuricea clavata]|uniref:Uncharacterized protein n=1 Tax=Paramuricea clavata TaxID=317549 RepID=A0A6S7H9X9_PARCT|nr:Hypothetical predicted protein [Paramuricea clavata]
MSANCQLSCRLCACRDFLDYADCQNRVSSYECETEPQWMADKCKLSCGFCGCRNVLSDEECQRRMMGGECVSNPIYMSSNCKHSCGYCNCKNRHPNCSVWAAQGECKKNSFWMDVYCTLSCGKCKNTFNREYLEIQKDSSLKNVLVKHHQVSYTAGPTPPPPRGLSTPFPPPEELDWHITEM